MPKSKVFYYLVTQVLRVILINPNLGHLMSIYLRLINVAFKFCSRYFIFTLKNKTKLREKFVKMRLE